MPAAAPLPDEDARLAALADMQILDTGADARLDSFVRLAADLYHTPIALISLVDRERQWFKASLGVEVSETPRDYAFCSHAILTPDEVLVVEDASIDPRFADNPLVLNEPGIRFYAGATVRSPAGQPLGTLCVIDREPGRMDQAGRIRLQNLANGVSALLELHRTATELDHVATHDRLTGLANRALFDKRLDTAVADALVGRPCALLMMDLDRFKHVNDTRGQMAGDQLLRAVAGRLRGAVRGSDLVARFGGDEFAILLAPPVDEASVQAIVARIVEAFVDPVMIDGEPVAARASLGIARCPLDAQEPGALVRAADQALYRAKRARQAGGPGDGPGGGPWGGQLQHAGYLAAPSPSSPSDDMEADLRAALMLNKLTLAWQPYIHTATGKIAGFEALTRWHRPSHGDVEPSLLIPFAEARGLIATLETWMVVEACHQAAAWPEAADVSVNLSATWFAGDDIAAAQLVALIGRALRVSGLAPARLCLEITERTLITARDVVRGQLNALRALGVRVALDDFGTGFSSLGYLRDLPFDTIKLDRSFVSALGTDPRADEVAGAIISLGHVLGMKACAEGVETLAQLKWLQRRKCDYAQGYVVGRPSASTCFPAGKKARKIFSRAR